MTAKLHWRIHDGLDIEVEVNSVVEAIEVLSAYSVLSYTKCGLCGSEEVHPEHRIHKGYHFYGLRCGACEAKYDFGQHKEGGTLFPKRERGWHQWTENPEDGHGGVDDRAAEELRASAERSSGFAPKQSF